MMEKKNLRMYHITLNHKLDGYRLETIVQTRQWSQTHNKAGSKISQSSDLNPTKNLWTVLKIRSMPELILLRVVKYPTARGLLMGTFNQI